MTNPSLWRGTVLLGIAGTAWGGLFPVAKLVMDRFDPFTLTLIRYTVASAILLALLCLVEGRASLSSEGKGLRLWFAGTLGFACFSLLAFLGLRTTRPEHASVIAALMPLIAILANWIRLRRPPGALASFCIALGVIGVALVVTHGDVRSLARGGAVTGDLLVLAGATCWVLYTLGAGAMPGWSSLRYTAITCAYGLISIALADAAALALGVAYLPDPRDVAAAWPELGYMVALASVIAVLSWNAGIRMVGAAKGVLFINLVPIVAFAIAIASGRAAHRTELAGVALVVAALTLNSLGGMVGPVRLQLLAGRRANACTG